MRGTPSLRGRVLAVLAVLAVGPALLVGALAIVRARADLEREVVRGNLALIRALGASLDAELQGTRRALELAAGQWADDRAPPKVADQPIDDGDVDRLVRRLRRHAPLIAGLSIVDLDGRLLHGDPIRLPGPIGAHSFGGYVGDVAFEDGGPRVRVVAQARSRTGELIGVFVADLDLGFVAATLAAARLGPGASLLVVDGEGVPVARSGAAPPMAASGASLRGVDPAVDRALGRADEGSLTADGVVSVYRNLSSYQSERGIRWAILLQQPERDAYALARATTRDTVLIGGCVLLAALALGSALASQLIRPLRALAARADAVAEGAGPDQASPPPPLDAPGEIGVLAQRLEEMARRVGERERLQQALARGDRLAAVGTMAASVAHELNNPLTSVLGYARLLAEDKPEVHADRAGLDLIAGEAARMKSIVGGLLDYARARPAHDDEPADVNQLLRRTAMLLLPTARRAGVEIELGLASALPPVDAPAHALQQVFFNLAHNAVQAMPDGGVVTLTSGPGDDPTTVVVAVTDRGAGVPAAERERIFEPFHTTKAPGAGTGLGLAVCRHLVAGFRGQLSVHDGPGDRGACFRVAIPTGRASPPTTTA